MIKRAFRRPDARTVLFLLALSAGGLAAWTTRHYIADKVASLEAQARVPMVQVVVAATDLIPGSRLNADTVAVREMPRDWVSDSAILPEHFAQVDAAPLGHAVRRGEPILWAHVAPQQHAPFSAQLQAGRRAVTLAVDEISSVSGMLSPGDVIDLYVSFEYRNKRMTRLLLPTVKVLATGQQIVPAVAGQDERSFSTVTLDTDPDQAVKVIVARQGGSISAVLRAQQDARQTGPAQTGDLASVFGLRPPPRRPPAKVAVVYGDETVKQMPALAGARPVDDDEEDSAHARVPTPVRPAPAWEVDVADLMPPSALPAGQASAALAAQEAP